MPVLECSKAIWKRLRRCGCLLVLGIFATSAVSAPGVDEYQVKAAFLYNFAKFVEWPPQAFKSDKDPIRICVLGQDPFGRTLGDAVDGKIVLGRKFVITEVPDVGQATECHMLFVSSSERKRFRTIFVELRSRGILTIGETEGFATQGGMVNFKLEDGRVRLEINVEAAGEAKLRISSQLLNLAQIVKSAVQK